MTDHARAGRETGRRPTGADLVLLDGRLVTMAPSDPSATSIAVVGDRIAAIGSAREIGDWIGPRTCVVELGDRAVLPGFIDSHCHLLWAGLRHVQPRLDGLRSIAELQDLVAREAASRPTGEWIVSAPTWHPNQLAERRYPTRWELDAAAPEHPVYLPNFHAAVASSRALEAAGIDRSTVDPPGGQIVRDGAGEPTGVLQEQPAIWLVEAHVPVPDRETLAAAVTAEARAVHAAGVTSIVEPALSLAELAAYERLGAAGRMPVRVAALLRVDADPRREAVLDLLGSWQVRPGGDGWLKRYGIKLFIDGAFFQGKARLSEPYADDAVDRRYQMHDEASVLEIMAAAAAQGWAVGTHSSGDAAVRVVLDAFDRVRATWPDARLQVIHAHLIDAGDLDRLADGSIVVVPQPPAIAARGGVVDRLLGPERAARLWPLASLAARGVRVAGSSDAPIYPIDPLRGIRAAVTRRIDGSDVIHNPDERLDIRTALATFTIGGAWAMGEQETRGTIEPGRLADFAVLSRDPLVVDPAALGDVRVEMTVLGGRIVYEADGAVSGG